MCLFPQNCLTRQPITKRRASFILEISTTEPKFLMLKPWRFFFLPFLESLEPVSLGWSRTKTNGFSPATCQDSPEACSEWWVMATFTWCGHKFRARSHVNKETFVRAIFFCLILLDTNKMSGHSCQSNGFRINHKLTVCFLVLPDLTRIFKLT